jgi:predicted HTH transcriptional regulator
MLRSADEVRQLAGGDEGPTLEFKRTAPDPRFLSRLIAALANSSGGTVLFGVDERGADRIAGVDPISTRESIRRAVSRLDPVPPIDIQDVSVDGRNIVVLDVSPAGLTLTPEGAYVRMGSTVRPAPASTVVDLVRSDASRKPESTEELLSKALADQTRVIFDQLQEIKGLGEKLDVQTQQMTSQGQSIAKLERGSHWSRQLFWCVLGVVLGAFAGALVTALLT